METPSVKSPLFTNKALVKLTIPIIIDALLAILAGTVDSAMVSSAGEAAGEKNNSESAEAVEV